MSKTTVGDVYAKVIDEVCAASQVDFEESGVEHGTLDLLKSVWQKKLSGLNVAHLPWDPKPEPPQPAVQNNVKSAQTPIPAPASTLASAQPPAIANGHVNSPALSTATPGPQIKTEPQSFPPSQQPISYPPPQFPQSGPMTPQQRAAMHLHQRYGNQAGLQIAQLQQQTAQSRAPVAPGMPQQQPAGFIKREDSGTDFRVPPDYKVESNQAAPVQAGQTDGPGDEFETEMARRRVAIAQYKQEGDRLMRSHFRATQQELEGGGLLVPLDARQSPIHIASRDVAKQSAGSTLVRVQGDAAGDDDDEEDEDAINSDLDDPNELENPEEQEENISQVMLCTYDKVQRVKNKWKCTLKDGILRVDQQEYVFHKGQGEFEW